jgi:hypothetical protein
MFLPGLVKWANELGEELETAAKRQSELYRELLKLEAENAVAESTDILYEMERIHRATLPAAAAYQRLFVVISDLCRDTENRERRSDNSGQWLIIANGDKMSPLLEQIGRFEKLHEMQLMDHLLPSQTSYVADKVRSESTLGLMNVLREHGAATFLLGLPKEIQRAANIALGELMMKVVPDRECLEEVFQGNQRLCDAIKNEESKELLNKCIENAETALAEIHTNKAVQREILKNPGRLTEVRRTTTYSWKSPVVSAIKRLP